MRQGGRSDREGSRSRAALFQPRRGSRAVRAADPPVGVAPARLGGDPARGPSRQRAGGRDPARRAVASAGGKRDLAGPGRADRARQDSPASLAADLLASPPADSGHGRGRAGAGHSDGPGWADGQVHRRHCFASGRPQPVCSGSGNQSQRSARGWRWQGRIHRLRRGRWHRRRARYADWLRGRGRVVISEGGFRLLVFLPPAAGPLGWRRVAHRLAWTVRAGLGFVRGLGIAVRGRGRWQHQ